MLGLQYARGDGVARDTGLALHWLDLAQANTTRQRHQKFAAARDHVAQDAGSDSGK